MANATLNTLDPILKTIYEKRAAIVGYENHAFLGLVPKDEKFFGKNYVNTVRFAAGQGRSATFADAQAGKTPNKYEDFTVTRVTDYAMGEIDGEALEVAEGGDTYQLAEGLQGEIDGTFETASGSLAHALYRTGGGSIGVIDASSTLASTTIKLTKFTDAAYFWPGQILVTSNVDGTGALNANSVTVVSVDRDAGTVTANANWSTMAGIALGHFIFVKGDYGKKLKGLGAWIPQTAPTAGDNFFGVDRSQEPVFLAGTRISGGGGNKLEVWQYAMSRFHLVGARITHGLMNPDDHYELSVQLENKTKLERTSVSPKDMPAIGYPGFVVNGPQGEVKVIADPDCPKGLAYALKLDTWLLKTVGKAPKFLNADGLKILRAATADSYEYRAGYRGNLVCKNPAKNGVIVW